MSLQLGTGQIHDVCRVGMEQTGGVDVDLSGVQTVDDDHIPALNGALAFGLQAGKECGHTDENEVGIGAEVGGIVTCLGVDRGAAGRHLLGMCRDVIQKCLDVDALQRKHDGGRHQLLVGTAPLVVGASGEIGQVSVTRAIDEQIGRDRDLVALAPQRHGTDPTSLAIDPECLQMKQNFHAGLTAHLNGEQLDRLGIYVGDGVMLGAKAMRVGRTAFAQPCRKFLAESGDTALSVLVQKSQQGKSQRHIAAEIAVFIDQ